MMKQSKFVEILINFQGNSWNFWEKLGRIENIEEKLWKNVDKVSE